MEERKGFLTPEQEVVLDGLIKWNNALAEKLDGAGIRLIDNQGLEKLKATLAEKHPEAIPVVYQIIDTLFEGLSEIGKPE
jgi:hypothetical protein